MDRCPLVAPGWAGIEPAARRVVARAAGSGGPRVRWHVAPSADIGRAWDGGHVDLVFIDGDHSEDGCRLDWDL